jgi:hypothetical protein
MAVDTGRGGERRGSFDTANSGTIHASSQQNLCASDTVCTRQAVHTWSRSRDLKGLIGTMRHFSELKATRTPLLSPGRWPGDRDQAQAIGLTGMIFSMISVALGAIMCWAITAHGHGVRIPTVGVILMVVGAFGLVGSAFIFATSLPSGNSHRTFDRQVTDPQGRTSVVHEEEH